MKLRIFLTSGLFGIFLQISYVFAHGGGESSILIGADQGITEFKKDLGFKLSSEAFKRLGIQSVKPTNSAAGVTVPASALVRTLKKSYVFRIQNGFIKGIDIDLIQAKKAQLIFKSTELTPNDEIITQGVGFLRILDLGLGSAGEEDEHGDHEGEEDAHGHEKTDSHKHSENEGHKEKGHDHEENDHHEHNEMSKKKAKEGHHD